MNNPLHGCVDAICAIPERFNWYVHLLYTSGDRVSCMRVIDEQMRMSNYISDYLFYVKGMICRAEGELVDSLHFFQSAAELCPHDAKNIKEVGKSQFLLGCYDEAIEAYEDAARLFGVEIAKESFGSNKPSLSNEGQAFLCDLLVSCGKCYTGKGFLLEARRCFQRAVELDKSENNYLLLFNTLKQVRLVQDALNTCLEGVRFNPNSSKLLNALGLLFLRVGSKFRAMEFLGNSLTIDPCNETSRFAVASIIQDSRDYNAAVLKHHALLANDSFSAEIWNNIGMGLFGKHDFYRALVCVKRACYLAPMEWVPLFNLGLILLHCYQFTSAFQALSAALKLKPNIPAIYMFAAIALDNINEPRNAKVLFEQAVKMINIASLKTNQKDQHKTNEYSDAVIYILNAAISYFKSGNVEKSKTLLLIAEDIWGELTDEQRGYLICCTSSIPPCSASKKSDFRPFVGKSDVERTMMLLDLKILTTLSTFQEENIPFIENT